MTAWGCQGAHNGLCNSLGWQGGDFAFSASFLILNEIMLAGGRLADRLHCPVPAHTTSGGDSSFPSSVTKSILQPCGIFWTQHEDELFIQKGLQNPSVYFKDFIREGISHKLVNIYWHNLSPCRFISLKIFSICSICFCNATCL